MCSSTKLQSFSSKAPHAFPNTLLASTAHLSCQPQPGFSVYGSAWALTAQGRLMAQGRLTEELPQAQTLSVQGFKADSFIAITWLHQLWALAAQEGWVWWGRRGARKEPPGSWWQFKTTARSRGDRCAGQGRHPKLLSFLPLGKGSCNPQPEKADRGASVEFSKLIHTGGQKRPKPDQWVTGMTPEEHVPPPKPLPLLRANQLCSTAVLPTPYRV